MSKKKQQNFSKSSSKLIKKLIKTYQKLNKTDQKLNRIRLNPKQFENFKNFIKALITSKRKEQKSFKEVKFVFYQTSKGFQVMLQSSKNSENFKH